MDRSLPTPALPGSGQGTGAAIRFHLSREWPQRPCVRLSVVMVIVSQRDGPCQACSFLYPLPSCVPFEWVHDWILLDTCRPAWYPEDDFLYTLHNPSGGLSMKKAAIRNGRGRNAP